ncbi:hypothetical protein [Lactococcus formosensis]|uniref:hypothetical protein n=1 Tax=Lactococcus formosensis TaxID=1281486 RepID=UPI00254FB806|nr:hypothetical protein [Lactococcus formosensis]
MRKELTVTFTYEEEGGAFTPLNVEYENINHSILAFCIASILYEEDRKKPCFSTHVAEDITALKGGKHGS